MKTSVIEQLTSYNGKIFVIQGTEDKNVYPESANILYTTLLSKGKSAKLEMVNGADHSFNLSQMNGWQYAIEKTVDWFLKE